MTCRIANIVVSAAGLVAGAPLLLLIGIAVLIDAGWPVLFRQTRAGRGMRPFTLLKFRTMRVGHESGPLTPDGQSAITRTGALLRATKLDELPQLWNILRGDMSIIGPRPEVFQFVDRHREEFAELLQEKPGLVDSASVAYFDEGQTLTKLADPVAAYERDILPRKLALSLEYKRRRSLSSDLFLIGTVAGLCARKLASGAALAITPAAAAAPTVARSPVAGKLQGGDLN
jgi:lipopolysaccharide/colanic/teichoic acid biosynthesis glycosyltransferase